MRKLRDLEKESGMTGSSKEGGPSSKKAEPKEEVKYSHPVILASLQM